MTLTVDNARKSQGCISSYPQPGERSIGAVKDAKHRVRAARKNLQYALAGRLPLDDVVRGAIRLLETVEDELEDA